MNDYYSYILPAKEKVDEDDFLEMWKANGVEIGFSEWMKHYSRRFLKYNNEIVKFNRPGADIAPPFTLSGENEKLIITLAEMVKELLESPARQIRHIYLRKY